MMPTLPENGRKKSFWAKPEGKIGMVVNILIAATAFYYWGLIVPFILAAAESTLHLIVVCGIIAAILYVAIDPNFRRFIWYSYRGIMRWITQWFVDLNPISVLKTYIETLKEKKSDLDEAIGDIKGQRLKLSRSLQKNEESYESSLAKLNAAKVAKNDSNPERQRQAGRIESIESKQVGRLDNLIKLQKKHASKYDFIVNVLTRYGEICEDTIADMANEVNGLEQQQEQAQSFHKGMSSAFGILKGMPEENEMRDMAMESLERDYTSKMGEVENALDMTKSMVLQADFNDEAAMQKADQLLNRWRENNSDTQMSKNGVTKKQLLTAAETGQTINVSTSQPMNLRVGQSGEYDKMFD